MLQASASHVLLCIPTGIQFLSVIIESKRGHFGCCSESGFEDTDTQIAIVIKVENSADDSNHTEVGVTCSGLELSTSHRLLTNLATCSMVVRTVFLTRKQTSVSLWFENEGCGWSPGATVLVFW